ncbi:unnamed protein product [Polarella glacialis]|uniref:Uncharacterized protein n=1 Tax=Polarella glacialis TaxID=89957 RepID=A0A813G5H4_POLGL|nr:unnamed protein product [Polarella glacialis]
MQMPEVQLATSSVPGESPESQQQQEQEQEQQQQQQQQQQPQLPVTDAPRGRTPRPGALPALFAGSASDSLQQQAPSTMEAPSVQCCGSLVRVRGAREVVRSRYCFNKDGLFFCNFRALC